MGRDLTPEQIDWIDRARDADILGVALAAPVSAKLRKHSREHVGPCPACGGTDRFAVNPTKKGGVFNCRGAGGGDVIAMVQHTCGVQFLQACEIINGAPMPGGKSQISTEEAERLAAERERIRAERDRELEEAENFYRDQERKTCWGIWRRAHEIEGTPAADYLRLRGISEWPSPVRLRCVLDMPFYADGKHGKTVIHRGPAMVAPIIRPDGKFGGIHLTWIDLAQPKGKPQIVDPLTGEMVAKTKKMRGSKQGGYCDLTRPQNPDRAIVGEGFEKTLAVWLSLHRTGADLSRTLFRVALDLGNLGGPHDGTIAHPTRRTAKGARERILGPFPALTAAGIPIADSVSEIIILGDSTSDPLTTRCALARAGERWKRDGCLVRVAWSPAGQDFDDLLRADQAQEAA